MRAIAVTDVGKIAFVEVPEPQIRDYECLVKITACGLCNGTDIKTIDGTLGNIRERYPVVLGHEAVGEVVEMGSRVRNFRLGDIITDPAPGFESDTCRPGCGGFCEFGVMQDAEVMRELGLGAEACRPLTWRANVVRERMAPEDAAMLVTLKETLSAARNFGVGPGTDLLLYGDGPNGLSLAWFARYVGAEWIGVVGHWDKRLERIARVARVDQVVNSGAEDVGEAIGGRRFDLAIDAVGSISIVREAFGLLKPCGKVGVFGVLKNTEGDLSIRAFPNGAALQMLQWPVGAQDVHDEVVRRVLDGTLAPSDFYSHVDAWDNIEDAIAKVRSREAFKVILTIG